MNIVFPELNNPTIQEALHRHAEMRASDEPIPGLTETLSEITALEAPDLATACAMVKSGQADTMIAGIDYSSRDVILTCKEHLGLSGKTFSGLAVMQRDREIYLLADMAACKHPSKDQLIEIIHQTHTSAQKLFTEPPRVALLSFSTFGSGGHDDTIELMQTVRNEFQDSEILLDGEMQLDAAVNPTVAQKKFPNSPVADLSRGSSVADVILTIEVMAKLAQK